MAEYVINDDGSITYAGEPTDDVRKRAEKAAQKKREEKDAKSAEDKAKARKAAEKAQGAVLAGVKPEVASAASTRETGTTVKEACWGT